MCLGVEGSENVVAMRMPFQLWWYVAMGRSWWHAPVAAAPSAWLREAMGNARVLQMDPIGTMLERSSHGES